MNQAQEYYDLNRDNLNADDLDRAAVQKDQNLEREVTAWIFEDGSAILWAAPHDHSIEADYGLNCDNENL